MAKLREEWPLMQDITFTAIFGNEEKPVRLTLLPPAMTEYQLYVNHYYWGTFRIRQGNWVFDTNHPGNLGPDDFRFLIERIETARMQG